MKKTNMVTATVAALMIATQSMAGGLAPVMAETPIVEETAQASSSANMIVPLILLALLVVAMSKADTGKLTPFPFVM